MNPLDLRGPEFLLFYLVFAAVVLVGGWLFRRSQESGPAPKMELDPYAIAFLRGGKNEALRVAIVSLIDRGLLTATATEMARAPHADPASVRRPLEKMLLEKFATSRAPGDLFADTRFTAVCAPYQATLEEHGLLPDRAAKFSRAQIFLSVMGLLAGLGGVKIMLALSRGRHNVAFLAVLMVIALVVAAAVCFPRLTRRGKAMLQDLRTLYAGLKARAPSIRPGGASVDAVMLSAIFGLSVLPAASFGHAHTLFPRATKQNASSSCGASCGSSCGGGGGGGGCGGCGGGGD